MCPTQTRLASALQVAISVGSKAQPPAYVGRKPAPWGRKPSPVGGELGLADRGPTPVGGEPDPVGWDQAV